MKFGWNLNYSIRFRKIRPLNVPLLDKLWQYWPINELKSWWRKFLFFYFALGCRILPFIWAFWHIHKKQSRRDRIKQVKKICYLYYVMRTLWAFGMFITKDSDYYYYFGKTIWKLYLNCSIPSQAYGWAYIWIFKSCLANILLKRSIWNSNAVEQKRVGPRTEQLSIT